MSSQHVNILYHLTSKYQRCNDKFRDFPDDEAFLSEARLYAKDEVIPEFVGKTIMYQFALDG